MGIHILRTSSIVAVGLAICAVLTSGSARAQSADPAEVEDLIRQGNDLRRSGKDHAAVGVFRKAYDLERSARTAAQLGLAESQMGYWVAAEEHLQEALAFSRHPWLEKNRSVVEQTLAKVQSFIGELEVLGGPSGATLTINGKEAGTLPLSRPVRVAEGPVVVGLRAPGHASDTTKVTVTGGQKQNVRLTLQPGSDPAGMAEGPAPSAGGVPAPGTAAVDLSSGGRPPGERPAWVRPAAWVAAVGGAVGLGVGVYGLTAQWKAQDKFQNLTANGRKICATSLPMSGGGDCYRYHQDAASAGKLALGGFIGGGALAAAAIVGFVMSAEGSGDERGRDVAFAVSLDGAGGRFLGSVRF